jgi:heat shock protein HtpX
MTGVETVEKAPQSAGGKGAFSRRTPRKDWKFEKERAAIGAHSPRHPVGGAARERALQTRDLSREVPDLRGAAARCGASGRTRRADRPDIEGRRGATHISGRSPLKGPMGHLRTYILLAVLTALFGVIGYAIGGGGGMLAALALAAAGNLFAYWNADKIVLRLYRAQEVDRRSASGAVRRYVEIVERLADRAGLPRPKITIIPSEQPNAFATGRDPEHAAVAATEGLLRMLNEDELAGVMAHELAHVKNRDTLTMTVTATIAGAVTTLAHFAMVFGGRNNQGGALGSIAMMILAPLAAALVQFAISRGREYEADRIGAEIHGRPQALAAALAKISAGAARIPNATAEMHPETGQLMIVNPLSGRGADNLFSTHPSTQNRIDRLLAMAGADRRAPRLDAPQSPFEMTRKGPWG